MNRQHVELDIEQLVFHGFERREIHLMGAALERELSRLFARHGAPVPLAESVAVSRLDVGAVRTQRGGSPEAVGAGVARAVFRGLGHGSSNIARPQAMAAPPAVKPATPKATPGGDRR